MEKVIDCTLEKDGFIGHFYPGTKETNKAIISVGGASCNEKVSIAMAIITAVCIWLANKGYIPGKINNMIIEWIFLINIR